jgi:hypothetical protein
MVSCVSQHVDYVNKGLIDLGFQNRHGVHQVARALQHPLARLGSFVVLYHLSISSGVNGTRPSAGSCLATGPSFWHSRQYTCW